LNVFLLCVSGNKFKRKLVCKLKTQHWQHFYSLLPLRLFTVAVKLFKVQEGAREKALSYLFPLFIFGLCNVAGIFVQIQLQ